MPDSVQDLDSEFVRVLLSDEEAYHRWGRQVRDTIEEWRKAEAAARQAAADVAARERRVEVCEKALARERATLDAAWSDRGKADERIHRLRKILYSRDNRRREREQRAITWEREAAVILKKFKERDTALQRGQP